LKIEFAVYNRILIVANSDAARNTSGGVQSIKRRKSILVRAFLQRIQFVYFTRIFNNNFRVEREVIPSQKIWVPQILNGERILLLLQFFGKNNDSFFEIYPIAERIWRISVFVENCKSLRIYVHAVQNHRVLQSNFFLTII